MTETKQKSDLSRAFSEDGELKTHVGGQALLEGIMMRGKYNWSVAVREPDGNIYTEEHDLAYGKDKTGWLYWPFIRGCRAFVESLALGYKALSIAAEHAFVEEGQDGEDAPDESVGVLPERSGAQGAQAIADGEDDSGASAGVLPERSDAQGAQAIADEENVSIGSVGASSSSPAGEAGSPQSEGASQYLEDDSEVAPTVPAEPEEAPSFSWKRDFGHPDEMIDALGAQRTLEVVTEPAPAPVPEQQQTASSEKKPLLGDTEMAISMVLGLVLGVVLFVVAPAFVTNLIVGEYDDRTLLWNVVDGVLRIGIFIFYIWLIGRMSDIKRMFGYHGAEHKTIHCFEHGLPLTPENARSFPRLHVRCGTAFLIMVMIIAIFVYTVVPLDQLIAAWGVPDGAPKLVLVIVVRILLMPVIAGIAYEITVKWAGSHPDNPLVKVILWPGMQMQYLTTREPDDGQIECAIAAMKLVLEREQREEATA